MPKEPQPPAPAAEPGSALHELPGVKLSLIPLAQLEPSPTNPRRGKLEPAALAELAASIRSNGVLQPILARPHPDAKAKAPRFEIIFGHRRAAAAKLAGLEEIPGRVVDLDDRATLEAQLEENLRRQDLHALEEAAGYHELLERHGYTADTLAARIGKSRAYVYARLKLCALVKGPARSAFETNELDASHALLIARVPAALQAQAYQATKGLTHRHALAEIQAGFMLQLSAAPFDTAAEDLVPEAGACGPCPKRTGNQRELFGDVRGAEVCTDPTCFKGKAGAAFQRLAEERGGANVLPAKKSAKLFNGRNLTHGSGFVDLDEPDALREFGIYGSKRTGPLREILGKKHLPDGAVVLAQDEQGGAHHLLPKAEALEAIKAAGIGKRELATHPRAVERQDKKKAELKKLDGRALVEAVLERVSNELASSRAELTQEILSAFVFGAVSDETARTVAKARGLEIKGQHPTLYRAEVLVGWIKTLPAKDQKLERRRLALELALQASVSASWEQGTARPPLLAALSLVGLKPAKVTAQAKKAREKARGTKRKGTA